MSNRKSLGPYLLMYGITFLVFLIPQVLIYLMFLDAIDWAMGLSFCYAIIFVVVSAAFDIRQIAALYLPGTPIQEVHHNLAGQDVVIRAEEVIVSVSRERTRSERIRYLRLTVEQVESKRRLGRMVFGGTHRFLVGFSERLLWYFENPLLGGGRLVGLDLETQRKVHISRIDDFYFETSSGTKKRAQKEALVEVGLRENVLPKKHYEPLYVLKHQQMHVRESSSEERIVNLSSGES